MVEWVWTTLQADYTYVHITHTQTHTQTHTHTHNDGNRLMDKWWWFDFYWQFPRLALVWLGLNFYTKIFSTICEYWFESLEVTFRARSDLYILLCPLLQSVTFVAPHLRRFSPLTCLSLSICKLLDPLFPLMCIYRMFNLFVVPFKGICHFLEIFIL